MLTYAVNVLVVEGVVEVADNERPFNDLDKLAVVEVASWPGIP
jgi:hypothetical protein